MPPSPSDRPRPPSVERVLASARERLEVARDPAALRAAARDVVDAERERLASGAAARSAVEVADELLARLERWSATTRSGSSTRPA